MITGIKVILASASPRRKELMEQIGIEFEVVVSQKEEKYESQEPEEIVKELSLLKARDVWEQIGRKDVVIIGADTVVVYNNIILGKPKDEQMAYEMLSALQGCCHQVFTGVTVIRCNQHGEEYIVNHAVETKVYVHKMSQKEIRSYIASGEPMDKAGAYGIQGKFAAYIEKIDGDYYNVVGLPIAYVYQELNK